MRKVIELWNSGGRWMLDVGCVTVGIGCSVDEMRWRGWIGLLENSPGKPGSDFILLS